MCGHNTPPCTVYRSCTCLRSAGLSACRPKSMSTSIMHEWLPRRSFEAVARLLRRRRVALLARTASAASRMSRSRKDLWSIARNFASTSLRIEVMKLRRLAACVARASADPSSSSMRAASKSM